MGKDMEINLLNPLTREQLYLPSQLTFDEYSNDLNNHYLHSHNSRERILISLIRKAILTCHPKRGECVVVMVLGLDLQLQVAFAKPGDSTWTLVPPPDPLWEGGIEDFIIYRGLLYGISGCGRFMVLDLNDNPNHSWKIILSGLFDIYQNIFNSSSVGKESCRFINYLVEIAGEFVVVVRAVGVRGRNDYQTRKVDVFKPLPEKGEWCQMNEIGDCCLFLGTNESTCISPPPRGFHSNCIYFTDDFYFVGPYHSIAGYDMVVYSMDTRDIIPFYDGVSLSNFSPPLWVTLNSCQ